MSPQKFSTNSKLLICFRYSPVSSQNIQVVCLQTYWILWLTMAETKKIVQLDIPGFSMVWTKTCWPYPWRNSWAFSAMNCNCPSITPTTASEHWDDIAEQSRVWSKTHLCCEFPQKQSNNQELCCSLPWHQEERNEWKPCKSPGSRNDPEDHG